MRIAALLIATMLLAGCANTELNSNRGPAYSDSYRVGRVVVIALMSAEERAAVEGSLTEKLRKVGVDAVRSLDAMPDIPGRIDWKSVEAAQQEARKLDADSLLLIGGLSTESKFETTYVPMSFLGGMILTPSLVEHRKKRFTVRLYDLSEAYAVWTAVGLSRDDWLVSPSIFGSYVSEAVVSKLAQDGLLRKGG